MMKEPVSINQMNATGLFLQKKIKNIIIRKTEIYEKMCDVYNLK